VDTGSIVRPPGRAAQPSGSRSGGTRARDAVPASLSAAQSVTAAAKSAEARAEDSSNVRRAIVDAESRAAIHQVLDVARRIVRQAPEEAQQRLRAYVRRAAARRGPKNNLDVEV